MYNLHTKSQTERTIFLKHRKFSCPISAAIRKNDLQTLTSLVQLEDFGCVINKCIHKSVSYIHLAVERAKPRIVELLLNNNAAVNLRDNNGNTPTHYVNDVPTLKILINHGARLDMMNKSGDTPLQTAEKEKKELHLSLPSIVFRHNSSASTDIPQRTVWRILPGAKTTRNGGWPCSPSHNYSFDTLDLDPLPSLFDGQHVSTSKSNRFSSRTKTNIRNHETIRNGSTAKLETRYKSSPRTEYVGTVLKESCIF
jgi:ankyrin repeat protein